MTTTTDEYQSKLTDYVSSFQQLSVQATVQTPMKSLIQRLYSQSSPEIKQQEINSLFQERDRYLSIMRALENVYTNLNSLTKPTEQSERAQKLIARHEELEKLVVNLVREILGYCNIIEDEYNLWAHGQKDPEEAVAIDFAVSFAVSAIEKSGHKLSDRDMTGLTQYFSNEVNNLGQLPTEPKELRAIGQQLAHVLIGANMAQVDAPARSESKSLKPC